MDDSVDHHSSMAARDAAQRAAELRERLDTLAWGRAVSERDAERAERNAQAAYERARRAASAAADSLEESALLHERVAKVMEGTDGGNSQHPDADHDEAARRGS